MRREKMKYNHFQCEVCGKPVDNLKWRKKYCSDECMNKMIQAFRVQSNHKAYLKSRNRVEVSK